MEQRSEGGERSMRPARSGSFTSVDVKSSQSSLARLVNAGTNTTQGFSRAYFWVSLLTVLLLFFLVALNMNLFDKGKARSSENQLNFTVDPADSDNELLQTSLLSSEEQYRINMLKRWREKRGLISTTSSMSMEELQANFLIPTYPCALQGRYGSWGEGGKWICLSHYGAGKPPVVISVGSKGDTSFESAIHQRINGFSHTFDFSLTDAMKDQMPKHSSFLKFYDEGISGTADLPKYSVLFPQATFVTVPEMMKQIGVPYVDIFKIDCEFCEHAVVKDLLAEYTRENVPFGQIQMEIHWINSTNLQMELLLSLESLGYRLFHAEINGWWTLGYELGLIHERLVKPQFVQKQGGLKR